MRKITSLCVAFLLLFVANDVWANDADKEYQELKKRQENIELRIKGASGAEKRGLENQLVLIKARLASLKPQSKDGDIQCIPVPRPRPKARRVPWHYHHQFKRKVHGGLDGAKVHLIAPGKKARAKIIDSVLHLYLPRARELKRVVTKCPKNRKTGVKFNRKTGVLTLYICSGRDGKNGRAGKNARKGISRVKVVMVAPGKKAKAKLKKGKLTLYLPKAKPGKHGKAGKAGKAGESSKDGETDGWLPKWLKWHVGGAYLLTHGPRANTTRNSLYLMTGLGFVVHEVFDVFLEGGLGYEFTTELLSTYIRGGVDFKLYTTKDKDFSIGIPIGVLGSWNLNRRNLAEYQLFGGTLGVRMNIVKHLRLGLEVFLGQRKWTTPNGPDDAFGAAGLFTIGYQF